jgi:type I restriction enzyme S subunit
MRLICFDFSAIQNVLPFIGKGVDTVWAFYATKDRIKFSEYKGHWPDFAIEKAVVPSVDLALKFRSTVDPFVTSVRNNELQIKTLALLRDSLLPRLISGRINLAEAATEII